MLSEIQNEPAHFYQNMVNRRYSILIRAVNIKYFQIDNDYIVIKYESFQLFDDLRKNINNSDLKKRCTR
jgi:hypothetical protein